MAGSLPPVNRDPETDLQQGAGRGSAAPGRFVSGRVHLPEWLVGIGGIAVLAGLLLPWSGGATATESLSLLKLLLMVVGAAAVAVPVVVAMSSRNDLPVAWETLLAVAVTLVTLVLLIRLLLPPDEGLADGFFVVLAGSVLTVLAGWRSVAREY